MDTFFITILKSLLSAPPFYGLFADQSSDIGNENGYGAIRVCDELYPIAVVVLLHGYGDFNAGVCQQMLLFKLLMVLGFLGATSSFCRWYFSIFSSKSRCISSLPEKTFSFTVSTRRLPLSSSSR